MVFVLTAPTVDGSTLPKLIGRLFPLSISPGNRLEGIVKPSVPLSVNDQDEDQDDNTAVVMIILRSLCLLQQSADFGSAAVRRPSRVIAMLIE